MKMAVAGRWSSLFATGLVVLLACFAPQQGEAARLRGLTLEQLRNEATLIVTGRCIKKSSQWGPGRRMIYTHATIAIDEVVSGRWSTRTLTVRVPGGKIGSKVIAVTASPQFEIGEETLLFLVGEPDGTFAVCGAAEGHCPLRPGPQGEPVIQRFGVTLNALKTKLRGP